MDSTCPVEPTLTQSHHIGLETGDRAASTSENPCQFLNQMGEYTLYPGAGLWAWLGMAPAHHLVDLSGRNLSQSTVSPLSVQGSAQLSYLNGELTLYPGP